jgi:hypothetical protein
LGIVALDGPPDPIMLMRRAWHGSVIFALAILLTFAIKIALVMVFVDANALADFATSLSIRLGSKFVSELPPQEISWLSAFGIDASSLDRSWASSILYMLARLAYASFVIGYGSPALGMAIVGMALATTAVLLNRRARRADEGAMRARLAILIASALVMPVWSLVFLNHTLLHAIWMVRPYGWYVALAGILWFWPVSARKPAATETGAPSQKR